MGWLSLGLKLLPFIVEAVNWVEKFITAKGKYKQDAAVYMVRSSLAVADVVADRVVLNDDDVEAGTRLLIDAVVALQNLIAKKRP